MTVKVHMLDCGHPSQPTPLGAGLAYHAGTGSTMCYDCAAKEDLAQLKRLGRCAGYIGINWNLETFAGIELGVVTEKTINPTGWHKHKIVCWRGTMKDGTPVYGRGSGPGLYTTIHKMKGGRK